MKINLKQNISNLIWTLYYYYFFSWKSQLNVFILWTWPRKLQHLWSTNMLDERDGHRLSSSSFPPTQCTNSILGIEPCGSHGLSHPVYSSRVTRGAKHKTQNACISYLTHTQRPLLSLSRSLGLPIFFSLFLFFSSQWN